jgi:adenylate kinase family enzyme
MKVFILGLPESGRSTVAQSICQDIRYSYVDGSHWIKKTFRSQREGEHIEQFLDAYHQYFIKRLIDDPNICLRNIEETMRCNSSEHFIIDGVATPRDFVTLFDYSQDFVVFLNRNGNEEVQMKDYEKIGVSVMRDYCFWMSAAGLLPREHWYEYNFKMTGGDPQRYKAMGSKNSVFIVGTLEKAVSHLKDSLNDLSTGL